MLESLTLKRGFAGSGYFGMGYVFLTIPVLSRTFCFIPVISVFFAFFRFSAWWKINACITGACVRSVSDVASTQPALQVRGSRVIRHTSVESWVKRDRENTKNQSRKVGNGSFGKFLEVFRIFWMVSETFGRSSHQTFAFLLHPSISCLVCHCDHARTGCLNSWCRSASGSCSMPGRPHPLCISTNCTQVA